MNSFLQAVFPKAVSRDIHGGGFAENGFAFVEMFVYHSPCGSERESNQ
jgi:hypothetical protein